ncbi:hypothetical protein DA099_15435 [Photobacterium damselae]|uniref:Uncharacterized protein n=1 Tax=Photobacterium damselae TaxID=38293 RepID=A0ACD3T3A5_PHODM|nr:DUF3820 family protein [Photobacterium damselae]RDL29314.1 hypothetical protein BC461_14465 [Photobacterium damselae]TMX46679.1 hypothetical protein DA099_15435 [Photobacterium damselae]TMX64314.1 hypothetical protein DA090_15140 [Photobacterium damselae]TMX74200.1 hypothetical protein DA092_12670 [Photobacterium damselae]
MEFQTLIIRPVGSWGGYNRRAKAIERRILQKKDFPEGELGLLMALALEFKIEELESVIKALKY